MPKLTMTMFTTLDGVVQAPGGKGEDPSGGFAHEGWLVPFFDADMGAFIDGIFGRADAFLLGRRTYEIFAAHWPKVTDPGDPVATKLNALPKHVVSRTLEAAHWRGTSIVRDVGEVAALTARYRRELQVHGSPDLGHSLLQAGLVDELHLLTFPVVLGAGKRLFAGGELASRFSLRTSQATSTGAILSTYVRDGAPILGMVPPPQ